ncbi:MAG: hypothetical protein RSE07_05610, partial [Oscillospiraceae bacterium]
KYGIIKIWNSILNFFDQVPIFFQAVGYGIADAFSYAKVKVLEIMEAMGNGVIGIINNLIAALNKIPGVSISPLNELSFAASAAAEEEAKRQSRANSLESSKEAAAAKAAARESEMVANRAADEANIAAKKAAAEAEKSQGTKVPAYEDIAKNGVEVKGGKLDSVGAIKDDISINEEDLKLLKDIAVAGFTQNYTTMRPEMTVYISDVKETADVNKIMTAIEDMVEEAYGSVLVGE